MTPNDSPTAKTSAGSRRYVLPAAALWLTLLCPGDAWTQTLPGPALKGPLIYHPFTLRLPGTPGDTLPAGRAVLFLLGIFDTGATFVVVNEMPFSVRDDSGRITKVYDTAAGLLNLCGRSAAPRDGVPTCLPPSGNPPTVPGLPLLDVRVWGMDAYEQDEGVPIDHPQAEVKGLRVRPDDFRRDSFAGALIGAPVANGVVARIDYAQPVSRIFFGRRLVTPGIEFFRPGAAEIPEPVYWAALDRFPEHSPAPAPRDQATAGQRYHIRDMIFRNGSSTVRTGENIPTRPASGISAQLRVAALLDTGNTTTQIARALALALGIDVDGPCRPPGCERFSTRDVSGRSKALHCHRIDAAEILGASGQGRYTVSAAPVCVDIDPAAPLFHGRSAAIVGSNYFLGQTILLDGPGDRLGFWP